MHSGMRYRHGNAEFRATIAIRTDLNGTETSINSTIEELKRRYRGETADKGRDRSKIVAMAPRPFIDHQFVSIPHDRPSFRYCKS